MQLWKNKNLTAEVNFWEISLWSKLTNVCEIVNFVCPDMSMQNTEIREGNLKKIIKQIDNFGLKTKRNLSKFYF